MTDRIGLLGRELSPTWRFVGPGSFELVDGTLVASPGDDIGLGWWHVPTPPDFELALAWRLDRPDDNSGVFVRFPDPTSLGLANPAHAAVQQGYEIQIDERAHPDGAPWHRTGAIYEVAGQVLSQIPARPPGEWNAYLIRVEGRSYTVALEGTIVARWTDPSESLRGAPSTPTRPTFVGIQTHTGRVAFRDVWLRSL